MPPDYRRDLGGRVFRATRFRDADAQGGEFVSGAARIVEFARALTVARERARP
jgi:hypothetical protein